MQNKKRGDGFELFDKAGSMLAPILKYKLKYELKYKRAQLSLFVVIGIIILVSLALFYASNQGIFDKKSIIPQEAKPVGNLLETCVYDISKEGVKLMGLQGGYINVPDQIANDPNLRINLGAVKVPFWHIKGAEKIPTIEEMQKELESYVNENLDRCVSNFSGIQNDFEIKELTRPKTEVTISENDIFVVVDYSVDVRNKNSEKSSKITRIAVTLPVKLKQAYEFAKEMMKKENSEMTFENITINLISMNSEIPFTGMEFQCKPLKWKLEDVRSNMMMTLYYNLQKIRFKNTNYVPFSQPESKYLELKKYTAEDVAKGNIPKETPEDAYDYFHHFLTTENNYPGLKAAVIYRPDFGLNLVASPSDNGELRSNYGEGTEKYLQYLCVNVYHFVYDIVYPVQITIIDPESFNGEGFTFNFAFPVQVKSNAGNRNIYLPTIFEQPTPYTGYCDQLSQEKYDIRSVGNVPFIESKLPLKDVNITYNCLKFQCKLGKIDVDSSCGNCRRLYTGLPTSGQHCFLIASKQGYLDEEVQVLDDSQITFNMKSIRETPVQVLKFIQSDQEYEGPFELEKYESALISVEDVDSDFTSYADFNIENQTTLRLIEGISEYNISIILTDRRNNRLLGGYKGSLKEDASGASLITFNVIKLKPTPISDIEQYQTLDYLEKNKEYKKKLMPVIS